MNSLRGSRCICFATAHISHTGRPRFTVAAPAAHRPASACPTASQTARRRCLVVVTAAAAEGESRERALEDLQARDHTLRTHRLSNFQLRSSWRGAESTLSPVRMVFKLPVRQKTFPRFNESAGERKEVSIGDEQVLLFWYRNDIVAIEPRSPAEGAYSEGFISSKLTPDNCIECPSTSSLFDLTTGEIKAWYPNNPVLRLLTPRDTARNMVVYPVKLESEAILVNVGSSAGAPLTSTRGGAGTSSARNNIYALQPQTYVQGSAVGTDTASSGSPDKLDSFTVGVAALGFGVTAITGTTISLINKSYSGLAVFWAGLAFLLGLFAIRYFASDDKARIEASKKDQ